MKCKNCANYKPKDEAKPKPKTTVTVWNDVGDGVWVKTSYTFSGTPNIPRIVRETLDEGALAVKVECSVPFAFMAYEDTAMYFWKEQLCLLHSYHLGLKYMLASYLTDTDMDDAVAKYLAAQKKDKPAFKISDIVKTCHNTVGEIEMLFVDNKAQIRFSDGSQITYLLGDLAHTTPDERKAYENEKYTFVLTNGVKVRAHDDGTRVSICIY
jgi:hypothetical protein